MARLGIVHALLIRDNFHEGNLIGGEQMNRDFIRKFFGKICQISKQEDSHLELRRKPLEAAKISPALLGDQQNQSHKANRSQHEPDDHKHTQNIQFGLEFVVAGGNSVERMIDGTAFFPSCHGNGSLAEVVPCQFFAYNRQIP
jgi:hypothetical protein